MSVRKILSIILLFLSLGKQAFSKSLHDYNVFEKWLKIQEIFSDVNFSEQKKQLDEAFLDRLKFEYEQSFLLFKYLNPFLSIITNGQINNQGYQLQSTFAPEMKKTFETMYDMVESDMAGFVDFCSSNFAAARHLEAVEKKECDIVIEQHKALVRLLFNDTYEHRQEQKLLAFTNRLFEYCFNDATFDHFKWLMINKSSLPAARFVHSILWYYLVGTGWKSWHEATLKKLKEKVDQGYRVRYIAGGNDLYQLLRKGMYNITVIDPFLPTQDRYYSSSWQWLVKGSGENGGLGDTIVCTFDDKQILLKRTQFTLGENFSATLSDGKVYEIEKSVTKWTVYNDATDEVLGTVIFDRRFTHQDDFVSDDKIVVLMSYDEMVYAAIPEHLNGWGINPSEFDDDFELLVKQLRKPVGKKQMQNIRLTSMMNVAYLKYINLASDPQ